MSAIGQLNESELHEQLKHAYSTDAIAVEHEIGGFVIDVVLPDELVEVQTRSFIKLRRKLETLSPEHRIRVVHPIALETTITRLSETGEITSNRRSPRHGRMEEIFRELTSIADLLPHPNITVEALLVRAVEVRVDDGQGSWRRRGVSIVSRRLADIVETRRFRTADDYLAVLPDSLPDEFTNRELMRDAALRYREAQPITSTLRKMGLIEAVAKRGREQLYVRVPRR